MSNYLEQSRSREPRLHLNVQLALYFAFFAFLLTSCAPAQATETGVNPTSPPPIDPAPALIFTPEEELEPTITTKISPTDTESQPESILSSEYNPSLDFTLGNRESINLLSPFTISIPHQTAVGLGWGIIQNFHMDLMEGITGSTWDHEQNIRFDDNGLDNSAGNMGIVVLTDNPNHIIIIAHSGIKSSIGKLPYMAGYQLSIGNESEMYGNSLTFTSNSQSYEANIIHASNTSTDDFFAPQKWMGSDPNIPLYARLDMLRLPSIDPDRNPNSYYITIVGCQDETPGKPTFQEAFRSSDRTSANQSTITLEFTLP